MKVLELWLMTGLIVFVALACVDAGQEREPWPWWRDPWLIVVMVMVVIGWPFVLVWIVRER